MRVLLVEQKWGVHTDKGAPITYQVTEQWESLSTATEVVEKSLEKDGLTWRTRKLAADLVEIDVQDADDTLIGLWDADALEKKTGMPILPTPGGPKNITFSALAMKRRVASSRTRRSSMEGWKLKSNWSMVLMKGKRASLVRISTVRTSLVATSSSRSLSRNST